MKKEGTQSDKKENVVYKIENALRQWLLAKKEIFFVAVLLLAGLVLRVFVLDYETQDMRGFFLVWYNQIKEGGGLAALSEPLGNYSGSSCFLLALSTYLPFSPIVAIKVVSIVFDVVLAFAAGGIVYELSKDMKKGILAASVAWLLPTVIINSAMWGQADGIYTAFLLLCAWFIVKKRYVPAFVLFGVAFGFKLQAIFWLPVLLVLWFVEEKVHIWHYFLAAFSFFCTMFPCALAGRSFRSQLKTYLFQMEDNSVLSLNMPNIYALIGKSEEIEAHTQMLERVGILMTLILVGTLCYYLLVYGKRVNSRLWLEGMLLNVLLINFFLPHMHERYTYSAVCVALVLAFFAEKYVFVFLAVFAHAFFACCAPLLLSWNVDFRLLALVLGGTILYLIYDLRRNLKAGIEPETEAEQV